MISLILISNILKFLLVDLDLGRMNKILILEFFVRVMFVRYRLTTTFFSKRQKSCDSWKSKKKENERREQ